MMDIFGVLFLFAFCGFVYCALTAWRIYSGDPEFAKDLERLRENRRRRKAAKR